jgi:hypothetical protein
VAPHFGEEKPLGRVRDASESLRNTIRDGQIGRTEENDGHRLRSARRCSRQENSASHQKN